jgi:hypothetical protein
MNSAVPPGSSFAFGSTICGFPGCRRRLRLAQFTDHRACGDAAYLHPLRRRRETFTPSASSMPRSRGARSADLSDIDTVPFCRDCEVAV